MQVTVFSSAPVVQQGIEAVLASVGFDTSDVDEADLSRWATESPEPIVVLDLSRAADLDLMVDLRDLAPGVIVVALVPSGDAALLHLSLAYGALAAIPLDSAPDRIAAAVHAAARRLHVVPSEMARNPGEALDFDLTEEELDWLRSLADGMSVPDLANRSGYSTRVMFRLLNRTYKKVGANGRVGALVRSARAGLI